MCNATHQSTRTGGWKRGGTAPPEGEGDTRGVPRPPTHIKALTRALLRSWASGDRCGTGLAALTLRAEVRSPPQEADSQYIEEGSLSKRMFSYVTFPNSFLSFPAS